MRWTTLALLSALLALPALTASSIGEFGSAKAKAHAKKGKPGRCGAFYYYDKKQKLCLNARLK